MAKQLNVNLAFTADTSSAKAQIQSLQKSLQEISKMPGKGSSLFDDTELKAASQAALELQQHLNAAINVDTGKLDLSRFSTSIKASGKDLNTYYSQLMKIGDQGQEAFLKLAQSISTAEAPVTRVNKKLTEMGTVLKNTARWQLSSSILHGFMGSLQSAYGYAQDLNESLINIRIVTGQSSDEMAAFAEKANKAAQSLSTTTTAYTDAALIFYQQGLGDKEVEDRTNVVIKMAQATGDAATDVSSYMTAIWNNFDDGSESLEHYSDVITALGAATASSSSEIAEGLSKFSAVAETAGLSYEYATSALATVVAKTRESADTVGNAFKTIFARIQDLELGETLDDGTDLGTYSQALEKVGVDIKDTSGELKDMDTVLDELGDKWNTLSNDTQLAVAQAVAGTRQYTQLMALMNNWDYMKENLAVAEDSEGTLEEQAEIYAESWEAAQKRVKAAAQDIYQDLIDDDFFIGITNGFEKVLESVNSVVETMGGFKGVVSSVGSIFLSLYAQKMPQALENLKANFMVLTGQAQKLMVEVQNETTSKLKEIQDDPSSSLSYKTQAEGIAQVTAMQQKLIVNSKNMTEQEKTNYQARIQNVQAIYEEAEALAKENEAINKEIAASEQALQKQSSSVGSDLFNALEENSRKRDTLTAESTQAVKLSLDTSDYQKEFIKLNQETSEIFSQIQQRFQEFSSTISNEDIFGELGKKFALTEEEIKNLANEGIAALDDSIKNRLKNGVQLTTSEFKKLYGQLTSILALSDSMKSQSDMWSKTAKELKATGQSADEMREKMSLYIAEIEKVGKDQGLETQNEHLEKLKELINSNEQDAEKLANAFQTWQESLDEGKTSVFSQQIEVLTNKIETLKSFMTDVLNIDPSAIDKYEQNVTNGATATERLNNALRNGKATASSFQTGTFAMSTALTQLSSSLMSTYTLITSVKNAVKTLTDDSSTGIEQLGAAVTAISGVIMTYSTYQQLANTLGKADIVIKSGQAVATGTATAAQKALNFAMNEFPLIGVISAITAVGAALYALVSNINSIKEFFFGSEKETLSSKLKKSTSATKNFKKSLEDVQSEWDTLTSDLNDYQDAVDALAACQKGTEDWYSAIKNVNSEVQTLINKYPELAKYPLKMDDNGAFYIDQSAINEAEEKYTQRTNILAGAEALNQNRTTETKSQINKEDLINELKENIQLPQIFSSSEGGYLDASDDLYSLIVDKYVEDASIEDIVGSIEDQVTNSLLQSYAQEYLSSLKTWGDPEEIEKFIEDGLLSRNDFGEITINQGLSDEDLQAIAEAGYRSAMGMSDDELSEKEGFYTSTEWIEGLLTQDLQQFKDGMTTINEDFRSTILQYQSELEEGSTSILNLSKATVDSVLGSEDFYENADNKDTIAERASQIYNDLVDEYVGEYENQDWKDIQDKLFNNYLDQNALDSSKFQEQVSFNKKTGDATYTDEDGNEKTVTKQELIDLQAVTDAFEALPEEVESRIIDTISATDENVAKYAQNISEEGEIAQDSVVQLTEKASNAVNDFANDKNFSNATLGEMKSLSELGFNNRSSDEDIFKLFTGEGSMSEDQAAAFGFNSGEEFAEGFRQALSDYDLSTNIFSEYRNSLSEEIQNSLTQESIGNIQNTLSNIKLGPSGEKAGKDFVEGLNDIILKDVKEEDLKDVISQISQVDWSQWDAGNEVVQILSDIGIQLDTGTEEWKNFISEMQIANRATPDFSGLKTTFSDLIDLQDATTGDTISTSDADTLIAQFPELEQYLMSVDEDTKTWITDFKDIDNIDLSSLISSMQEYSSLQDDLLDSDGVKLDSSFFDGIFDQDADIDSLKEKLQSLTEDTDASALLETLGYTDERLKELASTDNIEELQALYEALQNFMNQDYDASSLEEMLANTATNFQELQELWDSGALGDNVDAFNKKYQSLKNTLDEDVDTDEFENLVDYIKDADNEIEGLDKDMRSDEKQVKKVAQALLRYNSALEDVTDNYDDWMSALEAGDLQEQAEVGKELANTYGDLLDIDASSLSDGFLTSTENLKLLQEAANGSEEAYEELQEAAAKDILAQCGIDTSKYDEDLNYIESTAATANGELLDDLEVGASLDNENFLNGLTDIVNAAGMTADQATEYLSSMGIDAEVKEVKTTTQDDKEAVGWDTELVKHTVNGSVPEISTDGNGNLSAESKPVTYEVYSANNTPQTTSETEENTNSAFALEVTSANKKSGGNFKYSNSSNGGGSRRSNGSGTRSRGRSGNGSRSTTRRNSAEKKDPSTERYHKVSKTLSTLEKQYDAISKAKDRAFGKSKLKNLQDELKTQQAIVKTQDEYLKQAKEYLKSDKKKLDSTGTTTVNVDGKDYKVNASAEGYLGMKVQYDENNNISNYDELTAANDKKLEEARKKYIQSNSDDDAAKLAWEKAQAQYEAFQKFLSQYEETVEKVQDEEQNLTDAANDAYDTIIEITNTKLELKIEVNEEELKLLDYYLNNLGDDIYDIAEAITILSKEADNSLSTISAVTQNMEDTYTDALTKAGVTDVDKKVQKLMNGETLSDEDMKSLQENMTDKQKEQLKSDTATLLEENNKLLQIQAQIYEDIGKAFDDNDEKLDKQINKLQRLGKVTETYKNLVDIYGQKNLGVSNDTMNKLYETQRLQAKNEYDALVSKKEMQESEIKKMEEAKQQLIDLGFNENSTNVKELQEQIDAANDALETTEDNIEDAKSSIAELTVAQFVQEITSAVDAFKEACGGLAGNIDELQASFDRSKDIEEEYIPEYQKVYELTKLTRQVNNSIDNTSNIKGKKELNKLLEEINAKQEKGVEMSEYELEYLQKKYELKVAELALSEAQNAKSQVRLTQDSEGNYGYVYTADDSQVEDAEQNYEDKLYEMQQLNADYINTLQEQMIQLRQEEADALASLADEYQGDVEGFNKAAAELQAYYAEKNRYTSEQMGIVIENNKELYEDDVATYAKATDNKALADEDYIEDFSQTQLSIKTGYESLEDYENAYVQSAKDMYTTAASASAEYALNIKDDLTQIGLSADEFDKQMSEDLGNVQKTSEQLKESIAATKKEAIDDFNQVMDKVKTFQKDYSTTIDEILKKNTALVASFNELLASWNKVETKTDTVQTDTGGTDDETGGTGGTGGGTGDDGTGNSDDEKGKKLTNAIKKGIAAAIWMDGGDVSGWGNDPYRAKRFKEKFGSKGSEIQSYINAHAANGDIYKEWASKRSKLKQYYYSKFDTGGYTGEWGSNEGKFAMLHQKEIVLNADDTENFLNAINMVREISNLIDLNAMSASGGLGQILAASIGKSSNQTLEQEVHITAEFPNATNKDEILEAFDNVINLASQYANRK